MLLSYFLLTNLVHAPTLLQLSKKKDEHLELSAKDNSDKAEEYSTEADRIVRELASLGELV